MKRTLLLLTFAVLLAGCVNVGTAVKPQALAALKPGVTTLTQAEHELGKPNTVTDNPDGSTTIEYASIHASPSASSFIPFIGPLVGHANSTVHGTILQFNAQGVLTGIKTTTTHDCGGVTSC